MVSHPHVIPLHPRCGLLCTASDSYDSILYPHHHKACEILLVLEGLHEVQLEAGCITLSAGEMMLIRSNEIHSRRMIHKGRYLTIAFLPEELERLEKYLDDQAFQSVLGKRFPPCAQLSEGEMQQLAQRIERMNRLCTVSPQQVSAELRACLADCMCRYFLHPAMENLEQVPWLNRVLQEMRRPENICRGLDALLSITPYTQAYLCREFRRLLGCTPTEYIGSLRLDRAHYLLETTDMNIADICYEVGFDSVSYFYQLFRGKYGMPPAKYRKMRFMGRVKAPQEQREEE